MRTATALLALSALALGCYSFTGGKLPFGTVGVPVAVNSTTEYRATEQVTKALIEAVTKDGRMKLVEPKAAQGVIEVEITSYSHLPFVYSSSEQVSQYKVTIGAKAVFKSQSGKVVWQGASVEGWSTYAVDSLDEARGIERAAAQLAAEITRQALETW